MLIASTIKKLLLVFQYPRFSPDLSGEYTVGVHRTRIPGSTACQVHYPIASPKSRENSHAPYFRPAAVEGLADYSGTSSSLLSMLSTRRLPYEFGADVLEGNFPVIVFSHGLGGCMEMYSQLCANMASHGYLVLALEHEDGSGVFAERVNGDLVYYRRPDDTPYSREKVLDFRGPMLEQRVGEVESAVQFVVDTTCDTAKNSPKCDPLLEKILSAADTKSGVALVGHSFGAVTMALVAQRDLIPMKSVALLDPWCFSLKDSDLDKGVASPPVISILSESWTKNNELPQVQRLLKNSVGISMFWLPGTVHQSFADSANWLPRVVARRMYMIGKDEERHKTTRLVAELCVSHIEQSCTTKVTEESLIHELGKDGSLVKSYEIPLSVSSIPA